jgi:2,4-dienoyl-CoA reductase-like NADH-dependent reductase (Old Yellow Enzyme family)
MSHLFSPFRLRELTFKNRVFVSPMCQYSSEGGFPTDWHLVHLGSRAVGGAALVMQEATAVSPGGRISPWDAGLWSDDQAKAYRRITRFIAEHGAVPAIQIAHAGRKASTDAPWRNRGALTPEQGGWQTIAPSPVPFDDKSPAPREMSKRDIDEVVAQFATTARLSVAAGFEVAEIHAAHGYLLHEFLSPLSNRRSDEYGGSLANRCRLALRVASAVREAWPSKWPLFVRISATDWVEGGWDLPQSIELARMLKDAGADLIDCSSGGNAPNAKIPVAPGYQVPFAEAVRREAQVPTGAVGLITEPHQAEQIIATGQADCVLLARAFLRDPYWPVHAAELLGAEVDWPVQYVRARTASKRAETAPPPAKAR